ncbi:MAG: hypothetical protein Q8N88_00735 [Nanoarchaeota archaeon]|nr:hypothetical protein [Nanoarchaeota archaeon]
MHSVKLLQYSELISPSRSKGILLPAEIPLYPDVFKSNFAYTSDFVDQVAIAVQRELPRDISEIERILKRELHIVVSPEGIAYDIPGSRVYEFDMFRHSANPDRKTVDVGCGSANIAMDAREDRLIVHAVHEISRHPMSKDRLREYAFPHPGGEVQNIFWYIHNMSDGILPMQLYFRDFAIVFNNLGLERL